MFCCTLLFVHSSIAIILMGKRELVALLNLSSWCLVMVEWAFLAVPWGSLRFVIVVFPDHTHYFSSKFRCAILCSVWINPLYSDGFFLVLYTGSEVCCNKLGIVQCTYLGVSDYN